MSRRAIERVSQEHVTFMALCGDHAPPSITAIKRVERRARDAQHLRTWLATNPDWAMAAVASPQQSAR